MVTKDPKTFFSFGGGVQSTAIALLLIHEPEKFIDAGLTIPETIIFADTKAEPDYVYDHVKSMGNLLKNSGYNFVVVSAENINYEDLTTSNGLKQMPWFTISEKDGNKTAMLKRQCTTQLKINPIERQLRHDLGYQKGQRIPSRLANLWIGISCDESRRMRINNTRWINNIYPLIALGYNRVDCQVYNQYKLGSPVPKSACYFCPYTHRTEWERRKVEKPELFAKAVEIDQRIRDLPTFGKSRQPCFIHPSLLPLDEAVNNQLTIPGIDYGFGKECEGHCGV